MILKYAIISLSLVISDNWQRANDFKLLIPPNDRFAIIDKFLHEARAKKSKKIAIYVKIKIQEWNSE